MKIFFLALLGVSAICSLWRASAQNTTPSNRELATENSSAVSSSKGFVGDLACRTCHIKQFDSYQTTAHHLTSRLPSFQSIAGNFADGHNKMTTFNPQLFFQMEAHEGQFFETAVRERNGRTEKQSQRIDIVVGSATKGQTYLYWKGRALFELPVSYWTSLKRWVNSPGYVDGSADFDRPATPRCLECHATSFHAFTSLSTENRYDENFVLGISCERCHGPGQAHIQQIKSGSTSQERIPPLGLPRERQIDICAQCHAGIGRSLVPPFSFRPGGDLSEFIALPKPGSADRVDVHGNQVALLERSLCFRSAAAMTCSTCHDVHSVSQAAASYSARCMECHKAEQCGEVAKRKIRPAYDCTGCHMPVQESNQLTVDTDGDRLPANVRNHWIRIYSRTTSRQ